MGTSKNKENELFEDAIEFNNYLNQLYIYLYDFRELFENIKGFFINLDRSYENVRRNIQNRIEISLTEIAKDDEIFNSYTKIKLSEFELYLTKFIIAHNLKKSEIKTFRIQKFFSLILANTIYNKEKYEYSIEYICNDKLMFDWSIISKTQNENNKINTNMKIENKKEIESISWTGETKRDIAYIFWQLKKLNLIECKNLGMTLSKIITYLDNPIDNTYFNAEFAKFEKGEMPTNAIELYKILLKPKKVFKKLQ